MYAANINFDDYHITDINFKFNKEFEEKETVNLDFNTEITLNLSDDKKNAKVDIKIKLFNTIEENKRPFILDVTMEGIFSSEGIDDISKFLPNMASIMFPYIRNAITNITSLANVPPVILPTVNAKLIFENNEN